MLKLGVNVDHVATIRQARGTHYPSPAEAARVCVEAGAHGITIHLREDRRHIQDHDLFTLKERLTLPLNLELACADEVVGIACRAAPAEACLVPERRRELTTEGGLEVAGQPRVVAGAVERLAGSGIRVSLFIDPDSRQIEASAETGAPIVELHTGTFCDAAAAAAAAAEPDLDRLIQGAVQAHALGLLVNAGHGINLENISQILRIPYLDTLNIGHSIVARALFVGMRQAVHEMLEACTSYVGDAA